MTRIAPLLALVAGACTEPDDPVHVNIQHGGDDTSDTASAPGDCPAGMIEIDTATLTLGEWADAAQEQYAGLVIPQDTFSVGAFCVDTFPLPGVEGAQWPTDGLGYEQARSLDQQIAAFGRRACTVTELTVAAAGPDNWRYPYDKNDFDASLCDDGANPMALGVKPDCTSPFGVHDFQVRSSWARLDQQALDAVSPGMSQPPPGDGDYAVWGGSSAQDTFYAPSNFGLHFYGPDDDAYLTDGFRACAPIGVPTEEEEAAWADWQATFELAGSFEAVLD